MKVGLMTFHRANNYGAVLQAYALQEAVKEVGPAECEIIDYKCDVIERRYALKPILSGSVKQRIKQLVAFFAFYKYRKNRNRFYDAFRDKYLNVSNKTYNKNNIIFVNSEDYDTVITGSDQVWNLMLTDNDDAYYLPWCEKRKSAYAASFGFSQIPDKWKYEKADEVISKFDTVGVRELACYESGEVFSDRSILTVDPTLLWTSEFWDKVRSKKYDREREKYILLYIIANERAPFDYAKKLSDKYGMPVYYINQSTHVEQGFKNLFDISVEDFVDLVANAHTVITTSYHGFVFSTLYHRRFCIGTSSKPQNFNSRIETLLGHIGLTINDVSIGDEGNNSKLDYEKIDSALGQCRKNSREILEHIING